MLASGITSRDELCLTASNRALPVVEKCFIAISAGHARDVWKYQADGKVQSVVEQQCLSASHLNEISLTDCGDASAWEFAGNGAIKLNNSTELCLSLLGSSPDLVDVASKAAVVTSSVANLEAHGANMAVDGAESTFWAAEMDPEEAVTITVDLGDPKVLQRAFIDWEFPATSYSISLSEDGLTWIEVYSTDVNLLKQNIIELTGLRASRAMVTMRKPHPVDARVGGSLTYGNRSLRFFSNGLRPVLAPCSTASTSTDARDKWFQIPVQAFDGSASSQLRSQLPTLEASRDALGSATLQVIDLLPRMTECGMPRNSTSLQRDLGTSSGYTPSRLKNRIAKSSLEKSIEMEHGIHISSTTELINRARSTIIRARAALHRLW